MLTLQAENKRHEISFWLINKNLVLLIDGNLRAAFLVLPLLYQLKAVRLAVVILMVLVKRTEERTEHVVPSFFFLPAGETVASPANVAEGAACWR